MSASAVAVESILICSTCRASWTGHDVTGVACFLRPGLRLQLRLCRVAGFCEFCDFVSLAFQRMVVRDLCWRVRDQPATKTALSTQILHLQLCIFFAGPTISARECRAAWMYPQTPIPPNQGIYLKSYRDPIMIQNIFFN